MLVVRKTCEGIIEKERRKIYALENERNEGTIPSSKKDIGAKDPLYSSKANALARQVGSAPGQYANLAAYPTQRHSHLQRDFALGIPLHYTHTGWSWR